MNKPSRRQLEEVMADPELPHNQILKIPAVLYFPPEVLGQLNELCGLRGLTPGQLMVEAFKSQDARWDAFYREVMTPLAPGEPDIWPEDPLYILACITLIHFFRTLHIALNDPIAFEELKAHAPADWSFSSPEEQDEPEPADWWKAAD